MKDKQVGEHRCRVNARSKARRAHDTEAGPAVEDLQPQEPEDPQLHPEQALARQQQRRQWVCLDATVVQEHVSCHDVGTVQEGEGDEGGKSHGADTSRQDPREVGTTGRRYAIRWLCNTPGKARGQDGSRDRRLLRTHRGVLDAAVLPVSIGIYPSRLKRTQDLESASDSSVAAR